MIRSSIYYTSLNKTTKSGHVSSSGIYEVQKYYRINKLKKSIFQGLTAHYLRDVRFYTYHHRSESQQAVHAAAVLLFGVRENTVVMETKQCVPFVLLTYVWLLAILKASPQTQNNAFSVSLLYIRLWQQHDTPFGLHVKGQIFLCDFNQIWSFSVDFHNVPSIKFHRKPSGRLQQRRSCEQMENE